MNLVKPALLLLTLLAAAPHASAHTAAAPTPATAETHSCVLARTVDVYTVTLTGGKLSRIVVDGDGDTDLDLLVYDENGNLVDSDTDDTDYCIASARPRWTGRFTIKIVNLGRVANCYTLTIR